MAYTKNDLAHVENLVKALKKAKYDSLEGMEVLALAATMSWVSNLDKVIREDLQKQEVEAAKPKVVEPVKVAKPKKKAEVEE